VLLFRARKREDELLAAPATHRVVCAGLLQECRSDRDEDGVTRGVPVGVVDRLEVIEVEEQHRGLAPSPIRAGNFTLELADERAPVLEAGETVDHREALGFLDEEDETNDRGELARDGRCDLVDLRLLTHDPERELAEANAAHDEVAHDRPIDLADVQRVVVVNLDPARARDVARAEDLHRLRVRQDRLLPMRVDRKVAGIRGRERDPAIIDELRDELRERVEHHGEGARGRERAHLCFEH
jgi:hypothetical protein